MVGKAILGRRDQVIIATKCGLVPGAPGTGRVSNRLKAWSVRQEAEASLRRLGIECIDLYQIHWPRPDTDLEEGWTEIARLVEDGKVRYAGVSNFNIHQIQRAQAIHPIASLQPPYSMLDREVEAELLPFCVENQIGMIAYSPMASGLLTGAYTRERIAALSETDWRRTKTSHFQEPELTTNLNVIEKLKGIADGLGMTVGQLAVAWVLRRPEITAAIVGARRPGQIGEIAPAADRSLPETAVQAIEVVLSERTKTQIA